MAQSVGHPTLISAQVMISWFVRSSPESGSALTMQSLFGILSLSLSLCPSPGLSVSLFQNKYISLKKTGRKQEFQ